MTILNTITRYGGKTGVVACLLFSLTFSGRAHGQDLNDYKFRVSGAWWYPQASGKIYGKGNTGSFDLQKDFGYSYYSTFSANFDWRFKRKHHFLLAISPVDNTQTRTVIRTINFEDKTFTVGTQATVEIRNLSFAPGYQYDFISRDHGFFGLATQFYLIDTKASISGTAITNNGSISQSASGSTFSPVPVLGPRVRWYPLRNSSRLALDGFAQGMYFFGYGDLWTAKGVAEIGLTRHFSVTGGYLLGSALSVHGTDSRIGLRLRQKGAVVGLQGSW